jgi:hypothetical protein
MRLSWPPASDGVALGTHSLEHTIRAFRQECNINGKETPSGNWESVRCYMSHAGFRVRTRAEKITADFLMQSATKFYYEPPLRLAGILLGPDLHLTDYALP